MKICLIGNNLTSLILAHILSKKKFNVEIYSLKPTKNIFKTRTLGITNHNIKFLSFFFPKIRKFSNQINEIKVVIKNNNKDSKLVFNEKKSPLFYMFKYNILLNYLKDQNKRNKNVKFKKLSKNSDLMKLEKNENFSLIINCENFNLFTQKFLKNKFSKNYKNKAYTTIIKHPKINNQIATQVFTENGPIAYLPLSPTLTSVVFSLESKTMSQISNQKIYKKILEYNPYYKKISFSKIENFNLYFKLPKNYFYKNILFFGDTIHSIHPLAGQGFNMVIRDIMKLNNIIDERINLGLSIDKSIYSEFEKRAKSLNSVFSFSIDLIYELFRVNKNIIPYNISNKLFSFINKNKKIKDLSIKYANIGSL